MQIKFSQDRIKQIIQEEIDRAHEPHSLSDLTTDAAVAAKIDSLVKDLSAIKEEIISGQGVEDSAVANATEPWIKEKLAIMSALAVAIKESFIEPRRSK